MARLFGVETSRADILSRVGDIEQLIRAKPHMLSEGFEDGLRGIDVVNASGLAFSILPGRGMDISTASFNGRPLAWRSATSDTHPAYFDHEGENGRGWLRGFYGGLVVTCGLTWAGANGSDDGKNFGLHGRISNTPAVGVSCKGTWDGDEYELAVTGRMREATVFGENLEMERTITTRLGSPELLITDTVRNLGPRPQEHMLLYHINIGYPVVNAGARLVAPTMRAEPRDQDAREDADRYADIDGPRNGYREKVYFHDMAADEAGFVTAAICNPWCDSGSGQGLGVYVKYRPDLLPRFTEWKMLDSGTYVVGMEPANCSVLGRPSERAAGTLQVLEGGAERTYSLRIGVLSDNRQLEAHERQCAARTGNSSE